MISIMTCIPVVNFGGRGERKNTQTRVHYDGPQGEASVVWLYYVSWGFTGMADMMVLLWD